MSKALDMAKLIDPEVLDRMVGPSSVAAWAAAVAKMPDVADLIDQDVLERVTRARSVGAWAADASMTPGRAQLIEQDEWDRIAGRTAITRTPEFPVQAAAIAKAIDAIPLLAAGVGPATAAAHSAAAKIFGATLPPATAFAGVASRLSEISSELDFDRMLGITRSLSKLSEATIATAVEALMPPPDVLARLAATMDDVDEDDEFDAIAEDIEGDPVWKEIVSRLAESTAFRATFSRKNGRRAAILLIMTFFTFLHVVAGVVPFAGGIPGALGVPGGKPAADYAARKFDERFPQEESGQPGPE